MAKKHRLLIIILIDMVTMEIILKMITFLILENTVKWLGIVEIILL